MQILKVISTMNKKNIEELNLKEKNIFNDVLIINQVKDELITNRKIIDEENNITMLSFNEKGLSKSRNRGLENANADIILLTDDDVTFEKNFENTIIQAFEQNKDADIITFQVKTPEGDLLKNYSKYKFKHNKRSVLKVSSIEIAIKKSSIDQFGMRYDEKFGLGAKYISGEENIFLTECIKKGMNIVYEPKVINIHPKESSGKNLNINSIYSKGALFYKLLGIKSVLFNLLFLVKKRNILRDKLFKSIYYIYKGTFDYIVNDR